MKINSDCSTLGPPGLLFAGAVLRNHRGFFLAALSTPIGWDFPPMGELAVALKSLLLVFHKNWTYIILETDSIYVVNIFQDAAPVIPWRERLLWDVWVRIRGNVSLEVKHVFREVNQTADCLAKSRMEAVWFGNPPTFIDSLLRDDLNKEFFRQCV